MPLPPHNKSRATPASRRLYDGLDATKMGTFPRGIGVGVTGFPPSNSVTPNPRSVYLCGSISSSLCSPLSCVTGSHLLLHLPPCLPIPS